VAFWSNPEFIRHLRAETRAPRAIIMAVLALVVCGLMGLACWTAADHDLDKFFRLFHYWLVGLQFSVLGIWCASACGQAISRERELKTFDFLRTTRLTAWELVVGKILGTPIMAYFAVGCTVPVSVAAGLLGGISVGTLLGIYLLLLTFALFASVLGLWVSMLVERSSSVVAIFAFLLPQMVGWAFTESAFVGFGAMSFYLGILKLYHKAALPSYVVPTVFSYPVPFWVLTVFLYVTAGAWLVLMLCRNFKKERESVRLLSRWQAIGLLAYFNVLYFAFLDPMRMLPASGPLMVYGPTRTMLPHEVAQTAMVLNAIILFLVGLAMTGSKEKLRIWWRQRRAGEGGYFAADGLVWPWLIVGALVAYVLLAAEALGLRGAVNLADWKLGMAALVLLNFLVFVVRDTLFIQWCTLTRLKRPLLKGFLFLWLYYTAAGIIGGVASMASTEAGNVVVGLLTPWQMLAFERTGVAEAHASYVGMGLQALVAAFLVLVITRRLSRPATVPVPADS
jgi:hypothetical protein